jgi:hypothetical protein
MTQPTLTPWGIVAPPDEPARLNWKILNPGTRPAPATAGDADRPNPDPGASHG